MLLGLVGFAMIFLVVYLLISGKVSPMVIFVACAFCGSPHSVALRQLRFLNS